MFGKSLWIFLLLGPALSAQMPDTLDIYNVRMQMTKLLESNHLAEISDYYCADAVMVGFNGTHEGASEIESYWSGIRGKGISWSWKTLEWGGSEQLVYQRGISTLRLGYGDFEREYKSGFLVIWQETPAGYRILYDFYKQI